MGWCSGTPLFDAVVGKLLSLDVPQDKKEEVILALSEAMWNQDWDCESDSEYYDEPIVRGVWLKAHPDWFDGDEDDTAL